MRAVATSAVREARNGDVFLDRIQGRTGIAFEIINEAEESRLVFLAVRQTLGRSAALRGAWTLLTEVGGGSTSLTLLRKGQPNRSGGLRARRGAAPPAAQPAAADPRRPAGAAEAIDRERHRRDSRRDSAQPRHAHGRDRRRRAIRGLADPRERSRTTACGRSTRDAFLAFCDSVERLDEEQLVDRFRLPAVEAETLVPALLVYRDAAVGNGGPPARRLRRVAADRRAARPRRARRPAERRGLRAPGAGQRRGGRARYRFDRAHGRHVAMLAMRLFDECRDDHGLSGRERLLLQVAALLHDIGIYVSLRAHHKHSQYLLAALQIFGLSDDETAIVSNIARYHRRGTPQRSHLPYVALDRHDRLIVNKLAAILRLANALDAEHLQKVHDLRLLRSDADLDPRSRRRRRPDDGAARGDGARRHVQRNIRARR